MTLGKKIFIGFAMVLSLTIVMGIAGYAALKYVMKGIFLYEEINKNKLNFAAASDVVNRYVSSIYTENQEVIEETKRKALSEMQIFSKSADKSVSDMISVCPENKQKFQNITEEIKTYQTLFAQYIDSEAVKDKIEKQLIELHPQIGGFIREASFLTEELANHHSLLFAATKNYFNKNSDKHWKDIEIRLADMRKSFDEWYKKIERSESLSGIAENIRKKLDIYASEIGKYREEVNRQKNYQKSFYERNKNLGLFFTEITELNSKNLQNIQKIALIVIFAVLFAGVISGVLYAFFFPEALSEMSGM
ncbi:MAG: hypothetical protein HC887_07055 [Desulfobacteraceae bacterium]|nr:hypothetical protein [Desulfobacteraceae bacterium]